MSPKPVEQYAVKLGDEGRSARTIQAAIGAMKSFTRWLVTTGKLHRDPLASVKKPNPEADRKRHRRMLLPEEWPYLQAATEAGPVRHGMTGPDRALLYRLAIQTGLRANELRSLTRESVVLKATKPYVLVKAGDTKNRKLAQQFIDAQLAAALKQHVTAKMPTAKLFSLPHVSNLARMLRADLNAARKSWIDEAKDEPEEHTLRQQSDFLAIKNHSGESLDFHSLRHTCGAWMALNGAQLKTVQSVMRHSTITLTMDTYGHLFPGAEAEAAEGLGGMLCRKGDSPRTLRMTGTYDCPERAQRLAQQSGREAGRRDATACDENAPNWPSRDRRNSKESEGLRDKKQRNAKECKSAPSRTRT